MLIYDDVYRWEGWGGKLRLGHGKCRLRIFDLRKGNQTTLVAHLKPFAIVVSDVPGSNTKVKNWGGHIVTGVIHDFDISRHQMLWIEYHPGRTYGMRNEKVIPEKYELVEFTWLDSKAINPKWKPLESPLLDIIKTEMEKTTSD
jgi:hypothetical protein